MWDNLITCVLTNNKYKLGFSKKVNELDTFIKVRLVKTITL